MFLYVFCYIYVSLPLKVSHFRNAPHFCGSSEAPHRRLRRRHGLFRRCWNSVAAVSRNMTGDIDGNINGIYSVDIDGIL